MNEEIFELLERRYRLPSMEFYAKIGEWDSWWRGHNRAFHEFTENALGTTPVRRQLYRMNMAKKVASLTNVPTLELNSCHNVTASQFSDGVTYLDLMEQNLKMLKIALGVDK